MSVSVGQYQPLLPGLLTGLSDFHEQSEHGDTFRADSLPVRSIFLKKIIFL
jgi:hypothetical protein